MSVVARVPHASRVRLLRSVLAWAVRERMIKHNPAAAIRTGPDGARDIILDDAEAYSRLFQTLDRMEARIADPTGRRRRCACYRADRRKARRSRRRCAGGMSTLRPALITLPAAAHKTGKKTGKPRQIGLPAAAQALIARQPQGEADAFVFAPAKGEGPLNLSKPWTKIRAEAELPDGIGLHALRHSLASHMAMQGAQANQIMTVLGHRNITTSQKYVHWASEARQTLAESAASVALAGLAASTGNARAEVVSVKSD